VWHKDLAHLASDNGHYVKLRPSQHGRASREANVMGRKHFSTLPKETPGMPP